MVSVAAQITWHLTNRESHKQVRAPTIRGRPTPARKTKTKTISSTSSSLPTVHHPTKAVIPKALKRAERRANLLAKASDAENKGARALLKEGEYSISKSSIRRRKRKARDEIGKDIEQGRSGGVKEIMDVVDDLEMEFQANEEQEEAKGHKIGALPESRNLTANQRKRML